MSFRMLITVLFLVGSVVQISQGNYDCGHRGVGDKPPMLLYKDCIRVCKYSFAKSCPTLGQQLRRCSLRRRGFAVSREITAMILKSWWSCLKNIDCKNEKGGSFSECLGGKMEQVNELRDIFGITTVKPAAETTILNLPDESTINDTFFKLPDELIIEPISLKIIDEPATPKFFDEPTINTTTSEPIVDSEN